MKNLIGIWLMSLCLQAVTAQHPQFPVDSIRLLFSQTEMTTQQHSSLWNKDIYGPLMLVDPDSREIFANMPDSEGYLHFSEGIYRGSLPEEVPGQY